MRAPRIYTLPTYLLLALASIREAGADDAKSVDTPTADQTPIVIRISKDLFDSLTRDEIEETAPVDRFLLGARSIGTAHASARVNIRLDPLDGQSRFLIDVTGKVTANTVAYSWPVQVHSKSVSDFQGHAIVDFDGRKFHVPNGQVTARGNLQVQQITTKRQGVIGRIIRRIAARRVDQIKPQALALLKQETEAAVGSEFDKALDQLEDKLQNLAPLERTANLLFPETRSWVYHLSTTTDYLQAGVGPADSLVPVLPWRGDQAMQAVVECWVQAPSDGTRLNGVIAEWNKTQRLLLNLPIEGQDSRLRVITQIKPVRVGGWIVFDLHTASTPSANVARGPGLNR